MAYSEDLIKLRKRVLDAVNQGVLDDKVKDFYEATLIQIMNESERQRQNCVSQAEQLRRQASTLDGQASGYGAQSSIIYNVLNAYIIQAEKAMIEEVERKSAREKAKYELSDEEKENLAAIEKEQAEKEELMITEKSKKRK